ncbi:MAG: AAA family ATPase [Deltaproteobacteria bacterium]|nr:AAA family ATPase [Deltaproteobacteria bacterium]
MSTPPPALTAFSVKGYRSFRDRSTLELRPLTLIYGRNNSGKSTLIRALATLGRSVREDARVPWDLGGEGGPGLGGLFQDLPWKGGAPRLSVTMTWRDDLRLTYTLLKGAGPAYSPYVESLEIAQGSEATRWTLDRSDDRVTDRYSSTTETGTIAFHGLVPTAYADWSEPSRAVLDRLAARLRTLRGNIHWLHGARRLPERTFQAKERLPFPEPDGSGTSELLATHVLPDAPSLIDLVNRYYEDEAIGRTLRLEHLHGTTHRLLLPPLKRDGLDIELGDTGDGMIRVLPILTAAALTASSPVPQWLLLEDPEAHLHDDAVRQLVSYLVAMASAPTTQGGGFVLETHSHTLLMSVQFAVRQGLIAAADVGLYWTEQQGDGRSTLTRIPLTDSGAPKTSTFRQAFKEERALAAALAGMTPSRGHTP